MSGSAPRRYLRQISLPPGRCPQGYLAGVPAVRWLAAGGALVFDRAVTFLVGENGTGKSTLLEGIATALGLNPEGGSRNFRFATRDTHADLGERLALVRDRMPRDGFFLRAESFYNVATGLDALGDPQLLAQYGGVSLHEQSHGESFLALVQNRLGGRGLYLFDEPEAALSPLRQLTLLAELDRLVKADSQLIIATHSPLLMAYPDARIYQLDEAGPRSVEYRETDHFQLTRRFLADPENYLARLLGGARREDG